MKNKNIDRISQISDDMFALGKQFSDKAKQASNSKSAKQAFDIAERAYKLVLKVEVGSVSSDLLLEFISVISTQMLRADAWRSYLAFCLERGSEPLSKGELFTKMELLEFNTTRKSDGVYVIPPKKRSKLLASAKASQQNLPADTLLE